MSLPAVSVERWIHVEPAEVFAVLADPFQHPVIDGSGTVRSVKSDAPRLALGVRFGAAMQIAGMAYHITNTVVEFDEPRRIAWRHFAGHRWRYVLTPVDEGTLVREEWDASRLPWPVQQTLKIAGFPERNRRGMAETLRRLDERLGGTAGLA